jgi:diguanylate cyclase (GGDEF)-like protein
MSGNAILSTIKKRLVPVFFVLRSSTILIFLIISVLSLVAHKLGLMQFGEELSRKPNVVLIDTIKSGDVEAQINTQSGKASIYCNVATVESYTLCGLSLRLANLESIASGKNLSQYSHVDIEYSFIPLNLASERLKTSTSHLNLNMRTFNSKYSNVEDFVSLKFNTVELPVFGAYIENDIPLDAFFVAGWWRRERGVSFEDSKLDFTNVSFVELVFDDFEVPGDYVLAVDSIYIKGELISEADLLKILFVVLLLVIVRLSAKQQKSLKRISTTDPLTGLLNRRGMVSNIEHDFQRLITKHSITLVYFDIDDFKKINDTYGHVLGDELLVAICETVNQIMSSLKITERASFARLAGDEFVIIIQDCSPETAEELSKRIVKHLCEPFVLSSCEVRVGVSVGMASSSAESTTFKELLSRADSAMYYAKKQGKGQYRLFDTNVSSAIYYKKTIAENLSEAIINSEFSLRFMPIYNTNTLKVSKVEVLIRAEAESLSGVTPDIFIPVAEEYGVIEAIDLWVIEHTFKVIKDKFCQKVPEIPTFCINLSAIELKNPNFLKQLRKLQQSYQIDTKHIELEITETSLIEIDEISVGVLNGIKELGYRLALDDFGTGYTAFNQLAQFPVDCLKIDRTFVSDIDSKEGGKLTMVNAIVSIAKSYKLTTIGEGIETQQQLDYLAKVKCDYVQGFFLSKPLPLDDFLALIIECK